MAALLVALILALSHCSKIDSKLAECVKRTKEFMESPENKEIMTNNPMETYNHNTKLAALKRSPIRVRFFAGDVLGAAVSYLAKDSTQKVLVSNFSSHATPGGSYESVEGEEESLFQRSSIACRFDPVPNAFDTVEGSGCFYTKQIKILSNTRKHSYAEYPAAFFVDVGTVRFLQGTPNAQAKLSDANARLASVKIELMLQAALKNKVDVVVFGAVGCGQMQYSPDQIIAIFNYVLQKYQNSGLEVVFAIEKPEVFELFEEGIDFEDPSVIHPNFLNKWYLLSIWEETEAFIKNDKNFDEKDFKAQSDKIEAIELEDGFEVENGGKLEVAVVEQDTLTAATNLLLKEDKDKRIMIVNFANDHHIGGGYKAGFTAQEEDLFRRTTLSAIMDNSDVRKAFYPINTGRSVVRGLYTPGVLALRQRKNGEFQFIYPKHKFTVDVCSIAAFDGRSTDRVEGDGKYFEEDALDNFRVLTEEGLDLTRKRIEVMVQMALKKKVDVLVAGAFGCGAFKNHPIQIVNLFNEILFKYHTANLKIVFAVIGHENFLKFEKHIAVDLSHNPEIVPGPPFFLQKPVESPKAKPKATAKAQPASLKGKGSADNHKQPNVTSKNTKADPKVTSSESKEDPKSTTTEVDLSRKPLLLKIGAVLLVIGAIAGGWLLYNRLGKPTEEIDV